MSWFDLSGQADGLLAQVDVSQWHDDFADDVIPGEPIEAHDYKVERDPLQLVVGQAVESEGLLVDGI